MNRPTATRSQVLARMRKGDLPTRGGNWYCFFNDGTKVDSRVMHQLVLDGKVNPPEHASVYSPFTLAD